MNIDHVATRLGDRPNPEPGNLPLDHPYRRWWLPIIGPTTTCLLDHLAALDDGTDTWRTHSTVDLAFSLGLGKGTGKNSGLIRSFERITRFGFGYFDVDPGEGFEPCITIFRTTRVVPETFTRNWPGTAQHAHAETLTDLHHQIA